MQQADAEFLQIGQPAFDTGDVAAETVGVQRHTDPVGFQKPAVVFFAFHIRRLQPGRTRDVLIRHHRDQAHDLLLEIVALAVQVIEQHVDRVEIGAEPGIEMAQVLSTYLRPELVQNFVQQ